MRRGVHLDRPRQDSHDDIVIYIEKIGRREYLEIIELPDGSRKFVRQVSEPGIRKASPASHLSWPGAAVIMLLLLLLFVTAYLTDNLHSLFKLFEHAFVAFLEGISKA